MTDLTGLIIFASISFGGIGFLAGLMWHLGPMPLTGMTNADLDAARHPPTWVTHQ